MVQTARDALRNGNIRRVHELAGRIFCPHGLRSCCSGPFSNQAVCGAVTVETFGRYSEGRTLLTKKEAQVKATEEVGRAFNEIREQLRVHGTINEGNSVLVQQLRASYNSSNALQCPQCGHGPVPYIHCSNLQSHHGAGGVSNACPQCNFFAPTTAGWRPWDGTVPQQALGARPVLEASGQPTSSVNNDDLDIPDVADAAPMAMSVILVQAHVYFLHQQHPQQNKFKSFDLTAEVRPEEVQSLRFVNANDDSLHLAWLDSGTDQLAFKRVDIMDEENQLTMKQRQEQIVGGGDCSDAHQDMVEPPLSLEYFRHMFNGKKFPMHGSFETDKELSINLTLVLEGSTRPSLQRDIEKYWATLYDPRGDHLDLAPIVVAPMHKALRLTVVSTSTGSEPMCDVDMQPAAPAPASTWKQLLWNLICMVPLQIARGENNNFVALSNGMHMRSQADQLDIFSIADAVGFGMYDSILSGWTGDVRVISTMGMQSTGKSFWLNHFAGTLFNVSGGRCTDGVWMSAVQVEVDGRKCLLVALDFEGLGSFERSAQEDMLLSIFNAAVSSLTVYRTGHFFGRDTAATFQKFETGVGCIKGNDKLFQGQFVISIKDVMRQGAKQVMGEFLKKIKDRVMRANGQANPNNFISSMYRGGLGISPFPSPTENAYFTELVNSQHALFKGGAQFSTGTAFAGTTRHLMAKLVLKDWTSFGGQEATMLVGYLIRHLPCAISFGTLNEDAELTADHNLVDRSNQPIAEDCLVGVPCDGMLPLCVIQPPTMELAVGCKWSPI